MPATHNPLSIHPHWVIDFVAVSLTKPKPQSELNSLDSRNCKDIPGNDSFQTVIRRTNSCRQTGYSNLDNTAD